MTEIVPSTTTSILQIRQLGSRGGRPSSQGGVQLGQNPGFLILSLFFSPPRLSPPSSSAPETHTPQRVNRHHPCSSPNNDTCWMTYSSVVLQVRKENTQKPRPPPALTSGGDPEGQDSSAVSYSGARAPLDSPPPLPRLPGAP